MLFGTPLTVEDRIRKAIIKIMAHDKYVALSGLLMLGSRTVSDTTPTAYTNGRDEVYGRAFCDSLTDAELRFVILHEVYHKMYRHLIVWADLWKICADLANRSCDYVINIKLVDTDGGEGFIVAPKCVLLDAQYRDMSSAEVFNKLREDQEQNGGSGGGDDGEPLDEHGWEDAQSMDEQEAKELEREIESAIRQGALTAGKMGSGGNRDALTALQPEVDWVEQTREYCTETCVGNEMSTWRKPNRKLLSLGIYMPSTYSEAPEELLLAIDASGSISNRYLSRFLGEMKSIAETVRPKRVRVLYWDTKVCRDELYEFDDIDKLVTSTKPSGGGGTAVSCVSRYMSEFGIKPQAVIVLTDGYLSGDWGTWNAPVLWCIANNKNARPTVGKHVHVKI